MSPIAAAGRIIILQHMGFHDWIMGLRQYMWDMLHVKFR